MKDDRFQDAEESDQQVIALNDTTSHDEEDYGSDDYDDYEDFLDDDLNDTEIWTEATGGKLVNVLGLYKAVEK
jgi:hypothetical protein